MGNSVYGIGVRALNAAQVGLITTGHNISNANSPGFHRQEIFLSTNTPQAMGGFFVGQGVTVDTVRRVYNQFLENQVTQAQTQSSSLDTYLNQIKQVDNMLADASAGLSPALQEFFASVNGLSADPASIPSRQSVLSGAQGLAGRFQLLNDRFQQIRDGVNGQIAASASVISSFAQQIANLNQRIMFSRSGTDMPPSDLLDQRDQLIADLNKEIKVSVVQQSNGDYNVFIGSGQPLVVGQQAFSLSSLPSKEDPSRLDIALIAGSSTVSLASSSLQGGNLGGLLTFRSEALDSAQNGLGRVAIGLAQTYNDQHRIGQDLNGALGGNFFNVASPNVLPNSNNTSAAAVAAGFSDVGAVTTSDYRLQANGGANYTLIRLSDNATLFAAATLPQSVDGLTISETVAGSVAGESWLIQPTRNGARDFGLALTDPSKIAAAAPIRTSTAVMSNTGTGTISAGSVNSFNDNVTIKFTSATAFDVVDNTTGATLAKNAAYTSGAPISYNGWTVNITDGAGTPVANDTFSINKTVTSKNSAGATIGLATLASPSPVDPNLSNKMQIIFGSSNTYHLAGTTNNFTGQSTIVGSNGFITPAALAAAVAGGGSNPGFTGVATGATTIGTAGSGSYGPATGTTTTLSGGTISGPVGTVYTISGATLTVGDGTSANTTTVSGLTITVDTAATGTIAIQDPAAVTTPVVASTFTYTGKPATGSYTSNQPISFNGWTAQIAGSPSAGDLFYVEPNVGGKSDNRNAQLLSALQTQATLAGNTTYQGGYSQVVSAIGNKTREVEVTGKAQSNLVSQSQRAQQSLSGVNLDEEAANLMRYQQAYQASGKTLQIASTLFESILSLAR
ncbi:MAG: flagellar hook-associated protein FlgK [Deltaproteobacteria bacterium]|nr:flagellar hook-associated protein FlgK [Deltaproteobacteria bacterium]